MTRRVLVTGASIAGNMAAYWLARRGFDVTVVERAPEFRDGGQNIDLRHVGRQVLKLTGLEQAALDRGTGEEGTAWVDEHGRTAAQFITAEMGRDGPTAELEILRGDLARLLFEAANDRATYRFGDAIAAVGTVSDKAEVTFASGLQEAFDLVVVSEGVGSDTRELVFPAENDPRWMDLTTAYFTIPAVPTDDKLWRWYHAPGGRSVSLRPDSHGTTRAMLTLQKSPGEEQDWDSARQKEWLEHSFADAGWETSRVLAGMRNAPDFYFDVLRQVRMPRWSRGRVVLTGDAAWCATPLAGIGATLAVTGAYVLAGELGRHQIINDALKAYETTMRPMVTKGQGVPKLAPRLMNPHSRAGIALLHGALKVASMPLFQGVAAKLFSGPSDAPDISVYGV